MDRAQLIDLVLNLLGGEKTTRGELQEAMELLAKDVAAEHERRRQAAHESWLKAHRFLSRDNYLEKYRLDDKVFDEAQRRGWLRGVGSPYRYSALYYPDEGMSEGALAELSAYVDADTFLVTKKAATFLGVSPQKFAALKRDGRVVAAVPVWNREGLYDGTFYPLNDLKVLKEELGEPKVDEKGVRRWESLSEKQQEYLKVVRGIERGKEAYYLSRRAMFSERKKGGEWRWIDQKELDFALQRDGLLGGKGAVLKALAEKGYVERRSRAVKLTRRGRKLVKDMGYA